MGLFDKFKKKPESSLPAQDNKDAKKINEVTDQEVVASNTKPENPAAPENHSPEDNKKDKISMFAKLKNGLSKTHENICGKIDGLVKRSRSLDDDFFDELEEILIQADVGVNTSIDLVGNIRKNVSKRRIKDPEEVRLLIREEISNILCCHQEPIKIMDNQLTVIMVVGVNGAGKTTSIGKMAYRYRKEGKKVILAAGDTFRAAAIEQLQVWADRVGVELIKHQEGSDPGAVVFDAMQAAISRKADILIIDTAGRLQNKTNLMKEIAKIKKIITREVPDAPHEVLLVLDATTGQNAIVQARQFAEATGLTGLILTKLDGTAKGGIVIAINNELELPVKLVGIGEGIEDLRDFSPEDFALALFNEKEEGICQE